MSRILIVDDDVSMLDFLAKALRNSGHEVTAKDNGKDALALLLNDEKFDLVLTDVIMPGIDGIELSQKATEILPNLKIMFITGFSAMALGKKNPQKLGQPMMSKPFHLGELVKQVNHILAN